MSAQPPPANPSPRISGGDMCPEVRAWEKQRHVQLWQSAKDVSDNRIACFLQRGTNSMSRSRSGVPRKSRAGQGWSRRGPIPQVHAQSRRQRPARRLGYRPGKTRIVAGLGGHRHQWDASRTANLQLLIGLADAGHDLGRPAPHLQCSLEDLEISSGQRWADQQRPSVRPLQSQPRRRTLESVGTSTVLHHNSDCLGSERLGTSRIQSFRRTKMPGLRENAKLIAIRYSTSLCSSGGNCIV